MKSGGKELALELEAKGYDWVKEEARSGAAHDGISNGVAARL